MTLEAKYGIFGSGIVFRETFASSADVTAVNAGTSSNVTFSKGVASFNNSSSFIQYGVEKTNTSVVSWIIDFELNSLSVFRCFEGKHGFSGNRGWMLGIDINNQFFFLNSDDGSNLNLKYAKSTNASLAINTRYQLACVKDGTAVNFYLDGVLLADDGVAVNATSYNLPSITRSIGAYNNGTTGFFDGDIDLLNRYNKALAAEEVINIFNKRQYSGLIYNGLVFNMDARTGSFNDLISGTVPTNTNVDLVMTERGSAANFFENDSLGYGPLPFGDVVDDDFTFLYAAKTRTQATYTTARICSYRSLPGAGWQISDAMGSAVFRSDDVSTYKYTFATTNDGLYRLKMGVRSGSNLSFYINNDLVSSTASFVSPASHLSNFMLGNMSGHTYGYNGDILYFRFYNRVLSDEERYQAYQEFLSSM